MSGKSKTFSQLPPANTIAGIDIVPVMQSGVTKQSTVSGVTSILNAAVESNSSSIGSLNSATQFFYPSGDTTGDTDTAIIQSALTAMSVNVVAVPVRRLVFTSGEFYINAKLILTFNAASNLQQNNIPYEIVGLGAARLNQVTDNVGILEFQVPTNGFPNCVYISGIQFQYVNQQPSTNTSAICLGARSVNSVGSGSETTYSYAIKRCRFINGFRGIANTQPSGKFPWWGITVAECNFRSMSGANCWFSSPTSVGQPNISIINCLTEVPYLGGSEQIYFISACDTATLANLETLLVQNHPIIQLSSVSTFTLSACKGEACTYNGVSSGSNPVILLQNSYGTIDGFTLNGVTVGTGTIPATLVSVQNGSAGQAVSVSNLSIGVGAGTGTFMAFSGSAVNINCLSAPNILGLGTGPAVVNYSSTAGGFGTSKILQFATYPGGAMSDDKGDADFTWSGQTSPATLIFNTPLTTNRTVTLPVTSNTPGTNNLWNGVTVTVVRTANATGASNLTVSGSIPASKVLAAGQMCIWQWRLGLGWVQTDFGSL